jgi:hypothetical protein
MSIGEFILNIKFVLNHGHLFLIGGSIKIHFIIIRIIIIKYVDNLSIVGQILKVHFDKIQKARNGEICFHFSGDLV